MSDVMETAPAVDTGTPDPTPEAEAPVAASAPIAIAVSAPTAIEKVRAVLDRLEAALSHDEAALIDLIRKHL